MLVFLGLVNFDPGTKTAEWPLSFLISFLNIPIKVLISTSAFLLTSHAQLWPRGLPDSAEVKGAINLFYFLFLHLVFVGCWLVSKAVAARWIYSFYIQDFSHPLFFSHMSMSVMNKREILHRRSQLSMNLISFWLRWAGSRSVRCFSLQADNPEVHQCYVDMRIDAAINMLIWKWDCIFSQSLGVMDTTGLLPIRLDRFAAV